ncbi:MAG TPA: hypothetical protein VFY93_10815 [Planctomycetota bacterium]|nr:hypothetical protein [Planctomycetota bacterium]
MKSGITTIVGLGTVTALFLAIMSVFYLQQIPTKADLERLSDDIRNEHGLYLSAANRIVVRLLHPEKQGDRLGLRVECTLRADIRKRPETVNLYLGRIGDSILTHPDWRGKVAYVTVAHVGEPSATITRQEGATAAVVPPIRRK